MPGGIGDVLFFFVSLLSLSGNFFVFLWNKSV